ncbi:uncharacterized protein LOC143072099 [Mytilus galloprovincialis]|uniref:uncharacterized protein LOC143072099 n=1 Tax=Mytilus galloprovincialis TaxID=29158 RepID=UPI003F7C5033
MFYAIYTVIFMIHICLSDTNFDACSNYTLMKYVDRRAVANKLDFGSINALSDDFLDSGWYRIDSAAGENMPTEPPGSFHCGTWYPIWLKGTLPTTIGEEIVGQVCLQGFKKNCSLTWNIDIKYCSGGYLVYNLVTSGSANSGYCFGTEAVTATTETPSTSMMGNTDNPTNGIDPCTQYSMIEYPDRRAATRSLVFGQDYAISDDFLTSGWYRVERSTCERMPTSPPKPFHCGTWYPIWLNGQLPTTPGQQVRQTVCLQSFTQTCLYSWNVDIKLCAGDFFVYNLRTSKTASSGYCFGTSEICEEIVEKNTKPPKVTDNPEHEKKKKSTDYVIIALVAILSAVIVVLAVLLIVYCRKSRSDTNSNTIPSKGKTNKTGSIPTVYTSERSSSPFHCKTYTDSPPPYRSREPSVASLGNFNPERKLTPSDIFTVKDKNT